MPSHARRFTSNNPHYCSTKLKYGNRRSFQLLSRSITAHTLNTVLCSCMEFFDSVSDLSEGLSSFVNRFHNNYVITNEFGALPIVALDWSILAMLNTSLAIRNTVSFSKNLPFTLLKPTTTPLFLNYFVREVVLNTVYLLA